MDGDEREGVVVSEGTRRRGGMRTRLVSSCAQWAFAGLHSSRVEAGDLGG